MNPDSYDLPSPPPPHPMTTPPQTNMTSLFVGLFSLFVVGLGGLLLGKYTATRGESQTRRIAPSPFPTPTPDSTVNWSLVTNTRHGFSFKHPFYDSTCCTIQGPLTGNSEFITVLVDANTVVRNTNKPFNGFALYVDSNPAGDTLTNFVEKQKLAFLQNYKAITGQESMRKQEISLTVAGQNTILLKDYAWWGDFLYIPFPDSKKILIVAKREEGRGNFEEVFTQILSTIQFVVPSPTPTPVPTNAPPPQTKFTCPTTEWVNCMPTIAATNQQCSPQYLQWAQANCPNFKGAAY